MGRKSVRENKNIYQISRENAGLTREQAGESMVFVSEDRIEKIESGRLLPHPDEILAMSESYRNAVLCNYYCTNECPIGMKYVTPVTLKDLQQITLEVLNSLNRLDRHKNRLIEIAADGKIDEDEKRDFEKIMTDLENMSATTATLRILLEHMKYEES
ncbi:MAG: helix-turn-helix domain-containing protein [Lachnospiraceae bacterium]|nr:helix-turn-helix domain-containing protein [Lachnospiraceae bacterium]MBP5254122.1 helix-turn-helix domain-containing protein [Lachnospiraceae bacterium]